MASEEKIVDLAQAIRELNQTTVAFGVYVKEFRETMVELLTIMREQELQPDRDIIREDGGTTWTPTSDSSPRGPMSSPEE